MDGLENYNSEHLTEHLTEGLTEGLTKGLIEGLDDELSDDDLSTEFSDEDPDRDCDEDPNWGPDEDPDKGPDEGSDKGPDEGPDEYFNKDPGTQLYNSLSEYLSTQPRFPPKNRAGKPQNLSENSSSLKLFQLFFSVKEIENIVKQINSQATHIDFMQPWKSLTITEAYHYLECLVYTGIQSL